MNINTNSDLISERLKFYADTKKEKNKYFCFKLESLLTIKEALWRFFEKNWTIRAAWYEKINQTTGEVLENSKINIRYWEDQFINEKLSKRKR